MSIFINPFVLDHADYVRKVDIVKDYTESQALYLHLMRGISLDVCRTFVRESLLPGKINELKDPRTLILEQRKRGNRNKEETTFLQFLDEVQANKYLISPSMTVYRRPEEIVSKLGEFTTFNVDERNKYKKLQKKAKQDGDVIEFSKNNTLQTSKKENNNSLSGAFASSGNALYNKSSHSSLTSTCRCATSYANASNERFLAGNRHYYDAEVVMQDLINAERLAPREAIRLAIETYGLKVPTPQETWECIQKSSEKYWRNRLRQQDIKDFIENMTPEGRANIVYTGDLYQLAKLNHEFVREFIGSIAKPAEVTDKPHPEFGDVLGKADGDIIALVTLLCSDLTAGKNLFETKGPSPEIYYTVNATAVNVKIWLETYAVFIDGFLKPRNPQASIFEFPNIIREAVVTSDTDSTIFTTQMWTKWMTGSYNFDPQSYHTGYAITYIASQIVANALGMLCGNLGVGKEFIKELAMKNEYYFPGYKLTNIAKHYIQMRSACEGNVYKEMELDVKGVNLRSSKAPKHVTQKLHEWFVEILHKPMSGETYTIQTLMDWPINVETEVRRDIAAGGVQYLPSERINEPTAYSAGEQASQYRHYKLWNEVFAPKYGYTDPAPIQTYKVCINVNKKATFKAWLDSMEDRQLAERFKKFAAENKLDSMTSFQMPQSIARQNGIPKEVMSVLDIRRATMLIMAPYYLVLESFGIFIANSKYTRLMTDFIFDGELDTYAMSEDAEEPDEIGSYVYELCRDVYGIEEETAEDDDRPEVISDREKVKPLIKVNVDYSDGDESESDD